MATTPPESPREAKLKSRIIWSFWLVIIFIGLPTWWTTTSIYRASLPTESMLEKTNDLWYSIPICLSSSAIQLSELSNLASLVQGHAKGPQGIFKFDVRAENDCSLTHANTLSLALEPGASFSFTSSTISTHPGSSIKITYSPDELQDLPTRIAESLQAAYLEEHANIAYLLATNDRNSEKIQNFVQTLPEDLQRRVQKSANRAFKASSEYHLTFSLFTAGPAPSSWDIRGALDQYIHPIVHALSHTSNITIASQIQLYSSFSPSVQPQPIETSDGQKSWLLRKEDLTSFVNTAEWPLSPSIGAGPTLNFIAYVPDPKYIPLRLEDSQEKVVNSWLVPQWGGITILNPQLTALEESELGRKVLPSTLALDDDLRGAFETFRSQLLQLLGVPQGSVNVLPLQERLRSFQRLAGLSLYLRTSSNLSSLARLAGHLSSIPIPRHVLHSVEHALTSLDDFKTCLGDGAGERTSSWSKCLYSVREAFVDSEKAFFDKSMVGQVYFPDEHKVAVYLPLLGPIGVPLVLGLVRELKVVMAARRKR